jgi:hypothetical protein
MTEAHSKRAELLMRVLPYINAGKYDENDRYVVFGTSSLWDMVADLGELPNEREDFSLTDAVDQLANDAKLHDGRGQVAGRLSLSRAPKFKTAALDDLSPEQRSILHQALIKISQANQSKSQQVSDRSPSDVRDAIDASFAEELLGKLPKAVDRAVRLEKLDFAGVPNAQVRSYFEEAHRCYIYGFHVACAVLCRAILASALESICDPKRYIHRQTARENSYFKALVDRAKRDGLLNDDRPEWAIRIRDAGNEAIHDYPRFTERWRSKVDELLLNTRKVLVDLYTVTG